MKKLLMMIGAAAVAVGANAATIEIGGVTWTYTEKDDTAKTITLGDDTVGGSYNNSTAMPSGTSLAASSIPWMMTIDGESYWVTKIADFAFYGCTGLTGTLTIPSCVTNIGYKAFQGATGLTKVASLGGVTVLEGYAFTSVSAEFPDLSTIESLTGNSNFQSCSGLVKAKLGKSVPSINYRTFYGANSLTNVEIPRSVTSIGTQAFRSCTSLTGVFIPGPLSGTTTITIGSNFEGDSKLKYLLLGKNVKPDISSGSANMLYSVSDCKVFAPTSRWGNVTLNGTRTRVVFYGPGSDLDIEIDEELTTLTATPTTENALTNVLYAAPVFKSQFGLNTRINVTNALEVSGGAITAESLQYATFNSLTFKVNTQAQLDSVLAAVPSSVPLAIDASDSRVELTVPQGREVWVRLSAEGKQGKYTPKIKGLIISFL